MRWALILSSAGANVACLPLDDLSSYSSAWETQPSETVNGSLPDASSGEGSADSGVTSRAPLDAGAPFVPTTGADDGGLESEPDAGRNADGGASPSLDAGLVPPDAAPVL